MFIEVDGKRVRCELTGDGPPLAVVHGGLGHDHTYFRPWLDELGDVAQLVYIDLLGNGGSDDPDGLDELDSLTPWVDQLHDVRTALGFERWSVMGHSFGGIVVQAYALAHPTEVERLVLCTTSSHVDHLEVSMAAASRMATPEQFEVVASELFRPMEDDAHYEQVWRQVFPVYFAHPERFDLDGIVDRMTVRAAGFNACLNVLGEVNFLPDLPSLDVPSLVIGAERDWTFPPDVAPKRTAAALPRSTYLEIPDSGHYPWVEQPDLFVEGVRAWLQDTMR